MSALTDLFLLDLQTANRAPDESLRLAAWLRLLERLAEQYPSALPTDLEQPLARLTRNLLLDLWLGYLLGIYTPHDRLPGLSQQSLQTLLRRAIAYPLLRAEVFAWALAALDGHLYPFLRRRSGTLRRRLALSGLQALSLLLPRRAPDPPQMTFGRALLDLLFRATRRILPDEFAALVRRLDEWAAAFDPSPQADTHNPFDLLSLLLQANLTSDQAAALHIRLRTWTERLVPRHPFLAEPAADGLARLAQQCPTLPAAPGDPPLSLLDDLLTFLAALPAEAESLRSLGLSLRVDDFWTRRALLRSLPAFLARPESLPHWQALLASKGYTTLGEYDFDLLAGASLPASPEALSALFDSIAGGQAPWARQVLAQIHLPPAVEDWLERHLAHERRLPVLEALTDLQRAAARDLGQPPLRLTNALRLAVQSLLTAPQPQVSRPALTWLLEQGESALAALLRALRETWPHDDAPALHQVLRALGHAAVSAALQGESHPSRPQSGDGYVWDAISAAPKPGGDPASRLSPTVYLVCLLVHPDDPLRDGRPLAERLAQALVWLRSPRLDDAQVAWLERPYRPEEAEERLWARLERMGGPYERQAALRRPRLLRVLLEPLRDGLRAGAPARLTVVRLLERADSPQVIPLLRQAFEMAAMMEQAWAESGNPQEGYYFSEFAREAAVLAPAVLRALAVYGEGRNPFDSPALDLLEDILTTPARLGILAQPLSPAILKTEIWPCLAHPKSLSPDALPTLWDALRRALERLRPDLPWQERQNAELCLQAYALLLTHAPAPLDESGRERLLQALQGDPARPGHPFESLTRALLLLALARERPVPAPTLRLLLDWLTVSPLALHRQRQAEWRRHDPSLPDQAGDIFLVQGTAVILAAELLQTPDHTLPTGAKGRLLAALRRLAAPWNRALEARLTRSTHPLLGAESSPARALSLLLAETLGLSPARDPDWLTHPADLGYFVLMTVDHRPWTMDHGP